MATRAVTPVEHPAPLQWLPWMDEALRLYFDNKTVPVISKTLKQDQSLVCAVMKTAVWKQKAKDFRAKLEALYETRMMELWNLSPRAIRTMRAVMDEYQKLRRFDADTIALQEVKGFKSARDAAIDAAKDILNRTGLKAPERVEVESTSHHTETQETKLTYEQRLTLIKEQRAAGQAIDADLIDISLEPQDG